MPQNNPRNTTDYRAKKQKPTRLTWLQKMKTNRYARPLFVAAVFMAIGGGTFFWASAATTTYGLWSSDTIPKVLSVSDHSSIELGTRFQSKVAGYVQGVRFYKGAQNIGTHTGSLWDEQGHLLATATFTNETSKGWQNVQFSQPVSVAANVKYIVSYHAPVGHYSYNAHYFSRSSFSNKNLIAPQQTDAAPNGVYLFGSAPNAFPTSSGGGDNYWVDVIFSEKLISPSPAPAAPTGLAVTTMSSGSVSLSWVASSSASPTQYVVYRDGNKHATAGTTLTYTDSTVAASTTYSYKVQAIDSNGITSEFSTSVSITTPSANTGGGTGGTGSSDTCPIYPGAGCADLGTAPIQPSTAGYTGDPAQLTQIDSGHLLSGCNWDSSAGVTCPQTNLTLDHVHLKGALYWTGTGTLRITDSIIEGGTGTDTVVSAASGAPTVYIANSTLSWPAGQAFPAGSDDGSVITKGRAVFQLYKNNISGQPHGIEVVSNNTVVVGNWIHDLAYTSSDPHLDGIYVMGGGNDIIYNNYVDATVNGEHATAAIFFQLQSYAGYPVIDKAALRYNFFSGGASSFYNESGTNTTVQDNIIEKGIYGTVEVDVPATIASWVNNRQSNGTILPVPTPGQTYPY